MLHPGRILIYGIATFALLLLYNRFAGLDGVSHLRWGQQSRKTSIGSSSSVVFLYSPESAESSRGILGSC